MTKSKIYSTLAPFDYFLIVGVVACSVIYSSLSGEWDLLGMVAAIAGLVNVVLCAKGSIVNYIFGLVNVSLYAYISFKSQLYGDFALNALYYIPMQFIGFTQCHDVFSFLLCLEQFFKHTNVLFGQFFAKFQQPVCLDRAGKEGMNYLKVHGSTVGEHAGLLLTGVGIRIEEGIFRRVGGAGEQHP